MDALIDKFDRITKYATCIVLILFAVTCLFSGCKVNAEKIAPLEPTETTVPEETKSELFNLGTFVVTAYCPCEICCGKSADGYTATGTQATEGRTLSVDEDVIPFGTEVIIDGHTYTAEDHAIDAINGYEVAIFFDTHEEALEYNTQFHQVFVNVGEFV